MSPRAQLPGHNGPVPDLLQQILIGLALLFALVALGHLVADRVPGGLMLIGVFLLTIGLLVGLFVGIVAVAQPGNDVNKLSYLGYLGIAVVTPPAASLWAAEERTRAGTAVYVAAGLVVAFLLLRAGQVWSAGA